VSLKCLFCPSSVSRVPALITATRTKHEDSGSEILTPITDLKALFPYNKQLQKRLNEWNRHYQDPPQHWLMNFIPRAYLKRGYSLGEELCEYFTQHPDGCQYRIEYEPIGHAYCHVGTVEPRARRKGKDLCRLQVNRRNTILRTDGFASDPQQEI
jgi:hypothetical protein